jgi:hypothetical protein
MRRAPSAHTARDDQRMTDAVGSVWLAWSAVTRQAVAASIARPAAARLRIKSRCGVIMMSVRLRLKIWQIGRSARQVMVVSPDSEAVRFQNSARVLTGGFYAARSYSLMRPPRMGRRLTRFRDRSATAWSGRGGRSWRLR